MLTILSRYNELNEFKFISSSNFANIPLVVDEHHRAYTPCCHFQFGHVSSQRKRVLVFGFIQRHFQVPEVPMDICFLVT